MYGALWTTRSPNAPSTVDSSSTVSQDESPVYYDASSVGGSTLVGFDNSESHASSRRSSAAMGFGPDTSDSYVSSRRTSTTTSVGSFSNPACDPFGLDAADTMFAPIHWSRHGSNTTGSDQSNYSGYSPRGTLAVGLYGNGSSGNLQCDGSQSTTNSIMTSGTLPGTVVPQGQFELSNHPNVTINFNPNYYNYGGGAMVASAGPAGGGGGTYLQAIRQMYVAWNKYEHLRQDSQGEGGNEEGSRS